MIRKEIHSRADFASRQLSHHTNKLADSLRSGSIAGIMPQRHISKINQANRIWYHYVNEMKQAIKKF